MTIKTRFNIGERVFFLFNNEVESRKIAAISIDKIIAETPTFHLQEIKPPSIAYQFYADSISGNEFLYKSSKYSDYPKIVSEKEGDLFLTKEELLASL
tara:strand:- start:651 stop:944 length:294 start_codon:yes stop_codon:yes gene_type:complete